MQVCPQCQQQVPAPSSKSVGWAFLWGGIGFATGVLGSCVVGFIALTMVTTIGTRANTTFTTVGNSLSASS